MSLFITSLASGSNGNCYYLGSENEAVLIDAGISCREIEKRMALLGLPMQHIKGVFITHEHSDHIRGLSVLAKKHNVPVYITSETYKFSRLRMDKCCIRFFEVNQTLTIGDLTIQAFPKYHDASDPCSFVVSYNDIKAGVFTDIGKPCDHLLKHFIQCHAAFLESNYDEMMLETGRYPYYLKQRIRGGQGHLSNRQALDFYKAHRPAHMTHLILSHLSGNNNSPELVEELFSRHADGVTMVVASRHKPTPVYQITHSIKPKPQALRQIHAAPQLQFSFG